MTGKFYGNGFVRCKANQSSGCRDPHVTGVRYRRNSVSIMRLCDRWRVFSGSGKYSFFMRRPAYGDMLLQQHAGRAADRKEIFPVRCIQAESIVNTGWHHENIVPDILEINRNVRDFWRLEIRRNYYEEDIPHLQKNSQHC